MSCEMNHPWDDQISAAGISPLETVFKSPNVPILSHFPLQTRQLAYNPVWRAVSCYVVTLWVW